MRVIEKEVYAFTELSDEAKQVARAWYRDRALDYDWYESVFEHVVAAGEIMGISIDHDGKKPRIFFSGFGSQGDGACFAGDYAYAKGGAAKIAKEFPIDKELQRIATAIQRIQRQHFYRVTAVMKHAYRGTHENSVSIEASLDSAEDEIKQELRSFMRWIYRRLEEEYEHLMSDEAIDESIINNEYEFTENGKRI